MDTSDEHRAHSLRKSWKIVIGGIKGGGGRPRIRKGGKNNSKENWHFSGHRSDVGGRSKRERIRIDNGVLNGPT